QPVDYFFRTAHEVLQKKRLGDEFFDALHDGTPIFFDVAAAGEKNKRDLLGLLARAQFFIKLTAVEARHAVVANDEVGWLVHDAKQGVGAIRSRARVAMRGEALHQQVEDKSVVIDHQDFDVFNGRHFFFASFRERT